MALDSDLRSEEGDLPNTLRQLAHEHVLGECLGDFTTTRWTGEHGSWQPRRSRPPW